MTAHELLAERCDHAIKVIDQGDIERAQVKARFDESWAKLDALFDRIFKETTK